MFTEEKLYCSNVLTSAVNLCINTPIKLRPALKNLLKCMFNDLSSYSDIIESDENLNEELEKIRLYVDELDKRNFGVKYLYITLPEEPGTEEPVE